MWKAALWFVPPTRHISTSINIKPHIKLTHPAKAGFFSNEKSKYCHKWFWKNRKNGL